MRQALSHRFVTAGKFAKLLHSLLELVLRLMMLVGNQQCRHEKQTLIADLTDGTQKLLHLQVDMFAKLAQMVFLALVAGDGVGAAVHHDVHQRHLRLLERNPADRRKDCASIQQTRA